MRRSLNWTSVSSSWFHLVSTCWQFFPFDHIVTLTRLLILQTSMSTCYCSYFQRKILFSPFGDNIFICHSGHDEFLKQWIEYSASLKRRNICGCQIKTSIQSFSQFSHSRPLRILLKLASLFNSKLEDDFWWWLAAICYQTMGNRSRKHCSQSHWTCRVQFVQKFTWNEMVYFVSQQMKTFIRLGSPAFYVNYLDEHTFRNPIKSLDGVLFKPNSIMRYIYFGESILQHVWFNLLGDLEITREVYFISDPCLDDSEDFRSFAHFLLMGNKSKNFH